MELKINSLDSINEVAEQFLAELGDHKVVALYGKMGVGKTTFVKAVCNVKGIEDIATSPSFAIVNEYHGGDEVIYHFDFYRINSIEEAYDFGYEEYFYSGKICFIEWPELIEQLLPEDVLRLEFIENNDGSRSIKLIEG
jgi:tRNA threonylcarbamoyladenosine biosynthesis protein TsaE